jgi:hypothetical protein
MKKVSKGFFCVLFIFAVSHLSASDIAGAYTGTIRDSQYMLIVRNFGGAAAYFQFFLLDEEFPLEPAIQQQDGRYVSETGLNVSMRFEENVLILTNEDMNQSRTLNKIFGLPERTSGVYELDIGSAREMVLWTVEQTGDRLTINGTIWRQTFTGFSEVKPENTYVLDDGHEQIKFEFENEACLITADGEAHTLHRDSSKPLVMNQQDILPVEEPITGLYWDVTGDKDMLLVVATADKVTHSFTFYNSFGEENWGVRPSRLIEGKPTLDFDGIQLTIGDDSITLAATSHDEVALLKRMKNADDKSRKYFYENQEYGTAMIMSVTQSGSTYRVSSREFEKKQYFEASPDSKHVYIFARDDKSALIIFERDKCLIFADQTSTTLVRG